MKVSFYTLGCKVNQYETQMLRERFAKAGYETVGENDPADIYIINTCTVTNLSDRKSRQRIRRVKKQNENAVVVVTGCYAQTNAEAIAKIPGVSVIAGTNEKSHIVEFVEKYMQMHKKIRTEEGKTGGIKEKNAVSESIDAEVQVHIDLDTDVAPDMDFGVDAGSAACSATDAETDCVVYSDTEMDCVIHSDSETDSVDNNGFDVAIDTGSDMVGEIDAEPDIHVLPYEKLNEYEETGSITSMESRTRAYIKIQEGCDRFCSYCIIPYARGRVRSRDVREIVNEAEGLIQAGFKEIVLTGINTALYGRDFSQEINGLSGIEIAIDAISRIEGEFRIRLSSLEPNVVDEETAKRLMKYPKLCPHMHLSLQSGSDTVLKRMNRRYDTEAYRRIVDIFKAYDPNFAITTDIIVGFPGETEAEFKESLATIQKIGFSKVHAFKYSRRSGTKAAEMPDQIDGKIKSQRVDSMLRFSDEISKEFFLRNTGTVRRVLFERYDPQTSMLIGLTDNYIHTYCRIGEDKAKKYLNRFADVQLGELYEDGLAGCLN